MQTTIQVEITDQCNMKCPYCYIHQNDKQMTIEMFIQQFLKFTEHYPNNLEGYHIAYFGGEPLLNLDTIRKIEKYLNDNKINHISHLQTNALLLSSDLIKKFKENKIYWSYSYDGLWQKFINAFNKNNILQNSFDLFEQKFKEIPELKTIVPKTMISPENLKKYSLLDNYKFFEQNFNFSTPDFSLIRENIWTDEYIQIYKQQLEELTEYLINKTIETKTIKCVGLLELYLIDTFFGKLCNKRQFGCFSGMNGFVFTPTGIIYPCARFYHNNIFPLYDTTNNIIYEKNIKLVKQSNPADFEKCKQCKLYKYCNAGCTFSQFEQNSFNNCTPVDCVCTLLKISYKCAYKYYSEIKTHVDYYNHLRRNYEFFR